MEVRNGSVESGAAVCDLLSFNVIEGQGSPGPPLPGLVAQGRDIPLSG